MQATVVPMQATVVPMQVMAVPMQVMAVLLQVTVAPMQARVVPMQAKVVPMQVMAVPMQVTVAPMRVTVMPMQVMELFPAAQYSRRTVRLSVTYFQLKHCRLVAPLKLECLIWCLILQTTRLAAVFSYRQVQHQCQQILVMSLR